MSVDDQLIALVRTAIADLRVTNVREVRMFGGVGFMMDDHLLVAASPRGLLVRVGEQAQDSALARPGTRPMIMRGRRMEGYVYADSPGLAANSVKTWVQLAVRFVKTLPPKRSKSGQSKPHKKKGTRS
jgi:TfoX N-terminal domain